MKARTLETTRHALMAFVAALKDDGHSPENVRAVLRELDQYGDCSYWCPACYEAISKPEHKVGVAPCDGGKHDA